MHTPDQTRTFRTRVGDFVFSATVPLSHCKLVRDAVVAQILRRDLSEIKVRDTKTAKAFMKTIAGSHSEVDFVFEKRSLKGNAYV